MKPPCFDTEEQWENWFELDHYIQRYNVRETVNYCVDCTPEYADRMRAEGRCVHPEAHFIRVAGDYTGVINESYGKKLATAEGKRLQDIHNGTFNEVPGNSAEARPIRFLRHIVFDGKRSTGSADDKSKQSECASEEDNGLPGVAVRS